MFLIPCLRNLSLPLGHEDVLLYDFLEALQAYLSHLSPQSTWSWFLCVMWSRGPISFFIHMDTQLSLYNWPQRRFPPHSCAVSSVINQTLSVHGAVFWLTLLSHQSMCPAIYQNHRIQMFLKGPGLCSLGIWRLTVGRSHVSKDLENQLEKPGVGTGGKGFLSMSGSRRDS